MAEEFKNDVLSQEHESDQNKEEKMLMHDGAIVGLPPKSEEELNTFLHTWVEPTWAFSSNKQDVLEDNVMWLATVAHTSYMKTLATLYARNPRVYEQLAFSLWGNGYAETLKQHQINLLETLQKAVK